MATFAAEPARLSLLLAKEAPVAIILARIRAKLFHVVKWEYAKNVVEHGSWFEGTLYPDSSDVSFDGRHMVYFTLNPRSGVFSWTAICEPPHLKAVSFQEHDSTWYGGGFFPDSKTLWLYMPKELEPGSQTRRLHSRNLQNKYRIIYPATIVTEKLPLDRRMERDGWKPVEQEGRVKVLERASLDGRHRLRHIRDDLENPRKARYELHPAVKATSGAPVVDEVVTWADWDAEGNFFVARRGVVSRLDLDDPGHPLASLDLTHLDIPHDVKVSGESDKGEK
ncbi:MAG: hypothetical protein GYA24_22130 [Candidatus Lokiarchaeota archaeon]|nr:hypothetical protein [Candidatus Lokiarchaeota archaeon]